jgi:hypothetical protein
MGSAAAAHGADMGPTRLVTWRGTDEWRAESASVVLDDEGVRATGTQIGADPLPYRLHYRLDAAAGFVTRSLAVTVAGDGWRRTLELRRDEAGVWAIATTADGEPAAELPPTTAGGARGDAAALAGALDCDLGLSPLTNLMPIRRARLHRRAGSEDFLMAWVSVPDLEVFASAQRYEHVRVAGAGSVVRFVDRGRFAGFTAELELDADGLVVRYPELAERVG